MYAGPKNIQVTSTITLTMEQMKEAIVQYLQRNSISVVSVNSIREELGGGRRDETVGYKLDVVLGGRSSEAPVYRGDN